MECCENMIKSRKSKNLWPIDGYGHLNVKNMQRLFDYNAQNVQNHIHAMW